MLIMRLEKLSPKNARKMKEIAKSCFGRKYFDEEVKFWYDSKLKNKPLHNDVLEYYLAYDDGKPTGITGFFRIIGEKIFWLGYFAILKNERKKGMGSRMLHETLIKARMHGCTEFGAWTSSKRAAKFYLKNGFRKGRKRFAIKVDGKIVYKFPKNTDFYYKRCSGLRA